jgi:AcrR family transcriptional regulator
MTASHAGPTAGPTAGPNAGPTAGPRRRGRPRTNERRSDLEPREEILRAAAALFSTAGVSATRLSDVAAGVGVSPPALYHYFENLDAIVEALLEYVVADSAAFATVAAGRPGACADRLHALVEHHVERLTAGPYDLWFVAGLSEDESRRFASVGRRATQWRRAVAGLVNEGVERGEFAPIDSALAVAALSGLVYGALELRHRQGTVNASEVAALAVRALTISRSDR